MKIIIVTEVIAGNGHHKAAESLMKEINRLNSHHEVKIVHLLEIWNKTIEHLARRVYLYIILKKPSIWGWAYNKETHFSFLFKDLIANLMYLKIERYLNQEKPDVIIATHASGLTALSKLKNRYHFKLAAVFTDYHINNFWIQKNVDYYFVGHEQLKKKLVDKYSVESNRIIISGIPIDHFFNQKEYSEHTRKDQYFQLLVMGGGVGIGAFKEIVDSLKRLIHVPISVIVITGRNKNLYRELHDMGPLLPYPIKVFAYVEELYPIMKKSDLIITKPGGITISEALSVPIPILMVQSIPGQEEYNARFLIRNRSAIRIQKIDEIPYWVEYLYQHPRLHQKIKEHQNKIAKPNASAIIVENLIQPKKNFT